MAYSYTTASGATMIIPDSAIDTIVASNPTGIATSGVIALIGEADEGEAWTQDLANGKKVSENSYGPLDINKVLNKYGSGRLVDGFKGAMAAASSGIRGTPSRIILVKTNESEKASLELTHGTFSAKRGGLSGNSIQAAVSSSSPENAPTTNSFSYVPSASTSALAFRVNGGAKQTLAISANTLPSSLAATLTAMTNVNVVGGVNRGVISALTGEDIQLDVVSGQNVKIKLAVGQTFSAAPQVGDTVRIPSGSVIAGGSSENVGWYLVTAVSNNVSEASITAKKITAGAPIGVAAVAIVTPNSDLVCYSYMRVDNVSGVSRGILASLVGENITASATGSYLTVSLDAGKAFDKDPQVGDFMFIPSGSVIAGGSSENVGWYQIVSASNTLASAFMKAQRLSNGSPASVATAAITAVDNVSAWDPQIPGAGKSLEIFDNAGTVNINTMFKALGADSAATWLETLIVSSSELKKTVSVLKDGSNAQETFVVGGDIMMTIGYQGTTASCSIGLVSGLLKLQTTVTGGIGTNLDLDISKMATISQLVAKVNQYPGYKAAVFSTAAGQKSPSLLDQSTFTICANGEFMPGRIKNDLWSLTSSDRGISGSGLLSYSASATAGLPEDKASSYLEGGSKGATTGVQFSKAIDALQSARCNFLIPLVSRDASSDIADGDTEADSTYMVDAVNAAAKAHALAMSTSKVKRHRIALVSKRGTFEEAKASAAAMASFRVFHTFQDVNDLSASTGAIEQFQPWMAAIKAAGMQAASWSTGIYGPKRVVNISKAIQAAGDFDDENMSDLEDALRANLTPIMKQENGTYSFASDQMTYGLDNSEIYNSLQACYVADLMTVSLAESIKNAFVSDSVADVTIGAVQQFIEAKMAEFKGNKWIVGTAKYPAGWKSIAVDIAGSVIKVKVCVIEATTIKFIDIDFEIEGIKTSSAA